MDQINLVNWGSQYTYLIEIAKRVLGKKYNKDQDHVFNFFGMVPSANFYSNEFLFPIAARITF